MRPGLQQVGKLTDSQTNLIQNCTQRLGLEDFARVDGNSHRYSGVLRMDQNVVAAADTIGLPASAAQRTHGISPCDAR